MQEKKGICLPYSEYIIVTDSIGGDCFMKEYTSDKIRNVAVLSHDGAGKTAVVESLLLAAAPSMPLASVKTTSTLWIMNRKKLSET